MSDEAPAPRPSQHAQTILLIAKGIVLLSIVLLIGGIASAWITRVRRDNANTLSANNLRQISLALHNCNDAFLEVPLISGYWKGTPITNKFSRSLFFCLVPYVEQDGLYKNVFYLEVVPAVLIKTFVNPHDYTANGANGECSYAANWQFFQPPQDDPDGKPTYASLPKSLPDGVMNVVLFAEIYQNCNGTVRKWAQTGTATDYRVAAFNREATDPKTLNEGLLPPQINPNFTDCSPPLAQTPFPRGMNVCMGNGGVRQITSRINPTTWRRLCAPADGQSLDSDW